MPATTEPVMENDQLKKALESLLFITDHPLSAAQLGKIVGVKDADRVVALVGELKKELEDKASAVQVIEVADGFQMATRSEYAPFVRKLFAERMTMKLSTAAHETLSIIAYKQPLTRAEIEQIRGVEVIAALETLLEKGLIRVVGRRETVGRPLMYGTTPDFLRHFGLRSLEDLPPIDSFTPPEGSPLGASAPGDAAVEPSTTEASWQEAGDVQPAVEAEQTPVDAERVSESVEPTAEEESQNSSEPATPEEPAKPAPKNIWD
jgi:segregation and condensation protein B